MVSGDVSSERLFVCIRRGGGIFFFSLKTKIIFFVSDRLTETIKIFIACVSLSKQSWQYHPYTTHEGSITAYISSKQLLYFCYAEQNCSSILYSTDLNGSQL